MNKLLISLGKYNYTVEIRIHVTCAMFGAETSDSISFSKLLWILPACLIEGKNLPFFTLG